MAEWLSTDFFQAAETAADGANAHFGEIETAFTERADEIGEPPKSEQHREAKTEQQFRCEKFANEIELEEKEQRNTNQHPLAQFRFFNYGSSEFHHPAEKHFH
jgi:hypothetical protein